MRALRGDLVGVPLAGGLRHRVDFGDIEDRARSVAWIGPFVVDIDLIADLGVDLGRLVAANKNAAVGFLVSPEFGPDLEVLCTTVWLPDKTGPYRRACRQQARRPSW